MFGKTSLTYTLYILYTYKWWYIWALVVWETLQFLQHRVLLFSTQTAKHRLLKRVIVLLQCMNTLTFKSAKSTPKRHVSYALGKWCMLIIFFSSRDVFVENLCSEKLWSFREVWWNLPPPCCTSHLSTLWWKKRPHKCACVQKWGKV